MIQERYNRIVLPFFFLTDLTVLLGLYFIFISQTQFFYFFLAGLLWIFPSLYFNSYNVPRTYSTVKGLRPIFYTVTVFIFLYVIIIQLDFLPLVNLYLQLYFIITIFVLFLFVGLFRYLLFYQYRLKGKNIRNAVLLGQGLTANRIEKLHQDVTHFGYRFVNNFSFPGTYIQDLQNLVKNQKIDILFIHESNKIIIDKVSAFCDEHGLRLKLLLPLSVSAGRRAGLDQLGDYPVMDLRHEPLLYLGNRIMKRTMDFFMASLSIVFILTWLPVVVKLAQAFSYPGPLFFIQERIGRNGKIFNLYKFRTMVYSKESESAKKGQAEKTHEMDKRVPWFGRLLRRTNLDEYPQFLNVLSGSMSTVGPRPHMVGEDKVLVKKVRRYRVRRFVKPGITGWAAINGYRGGTDDIELMSKRTEHDIWYLENWTIWLDIKIMAITIWQMITLRIPRAY